jgi:hypothetical protein
VIYAPAQRSIIARDRWLAARRRLPRVELAAILAHDAPMTRARAARLYRVPVADVERVLERRCPREPRVAVP